MPRGLSGFSSLKTQLPLLHSDLSPAYHTGNLVLPSLRLQEQLTDLSQIYDG